MPLALPTPDFEPSTAHLARHLASFRSQPVELIPRAGGDPHPGEDEDDDPVGTHPTLQLRQLSLVFGERH